MFEEAVKTRDKLIEQGYEPTLINMRFIKPIDEAMIEKVCQTHKLIAVIEEKCPDWSMRRACIRIRDAKNASVTRPDTGTPG